jgi:hypothetical protein
MTFFEPGNDYSYRRDGYSPPEEWRFFQCVAVATFPGTATRIAFGFITTGLPTSPWTPTGLGDRDWAQGWFRDTEQDPTTKH